MDALNFVYNAFFEVPATEAGVFFANGEVWKRNRHTVMMILHKQSFRSKSIDVFNRKADNLVKQWLSRQGNDTQLELLDEMIKFSTDAIGELCYSIDFGSIEGKYFEFVEHVRFLLRFVNRYLYAPAKVLTAMKYLAPIIPEQRQFNKSVEYLRAKGQVLLQDRLSDTSGVKKDDILALLLEAQPKGLTTVDVNSILFDLVGAGHDSVSNLFATCLALLAAHPESQQRLFEEIEQHMRNRDYLFEDDLRAMPYLTAVVKESLRLFPSGALTTRMSSEDTQLGGHQIPAGTPLLLLYYTFLRHPKFWTEPEAFKPERWLVEKNCPRFNNVANIPFGAGARGCIGGRFASTEAKVIVAKVIRRFRLEPLFNCKTDLDSQVQFTLRPAKPLRVKLCPRM
jgi:cytochrome P450